MPARKLTPPRSSRPPSDGPFVALLRGVNVGGAKKVPMAMLRELAAELGWKEAQTYAQSGNLVFRARGAPEDLEHALERAIAARLGLEVPVIVRSAADWAKYAKGSAFADAESERPKMLHLGLAKDRVSPRCLDDLARHCTAGERVALDGDALWIDYGGGVARSKLTPAALDRAVGSVVTARNWNTVQALARILRGE